MGGLPVACVVVAGLALASGMAHERDLVAVLQPGTLPTAGSPFAEPNASTHVHTSRGGSVVESVNGPFPKAATDHATYRSLVLENGVRIILVSDQNLPIAAAAATVRVGSLDDPPDVPGLAHFNEHMNFMSSERFPEEDGYMAFMDQHGGGTNAFTALMETTFYFSVMPKYFPEGLSRLGDALGSPSFAKGASTDQTDRERNAVNNEHEKNLLDDGWKGEQLSRDISTKPYNRFSTGNKETLRGGAEAAALLDNVTSFWQAHYTADRMTVAILGVHTLDELQGFADAAFGAIRATPQGTPGTLTSSPDWETLRGGRTPSVVTWLPSMLATPSAS